MEDNTKALRGSKRTSVTAVEQNKSGVPTVSGEKTTVNLSKRFLREATQMANQRTLIVVVAPPASGKTSMMSGLWQHAVTIDMDHEQEIAEVYADMRREHGSGWWKDHKKAIFRKPAMRRALTSWLSSYMLETTYGFNGVTVIFTAETLIFDVLHKQAALLKAANVHVHTIGYIPPLADHERNVASRIAKNERGPTWQGEELIKNRTYFADKMDDAINGSPSWRWWRNDHSSESMLDGVWTMKHLRESIISMAESKIQARRKAYLRVVSTARDAYLAITSELNQPIDASNDFSGALDNGRSVMPFGMVFTDEITHALAREVGLNNPGLTPYGARALLCHYANRLAGTVTAYSVMSTHSEMVRAHELVSQCFGAERYATMCAELRIYDLSHPDEVGYYLPIDEDTHA